MLTDYYRAYQIYTNTAADSFDAATWVLQGTEKGFIQPAGGGEVFRDQKSGEESTHKLYTGVSVTINKGDKVSQGGQDYIVVSARQPDGVSAVQHHKEISLKVFD